MVRAKHRPLTLPRRYERLDSHRVNLGPGMCNRKAPLHVMFFNVLTYACSLPNYRKDCSSNLQPQDIANIGGEIMSMMHTLTYFCVEVDGVL